MKRRLEAAFSHLLALLFILSGAIQAEPGVDHRFTMARVRYSGGGDWYGNENSWANLLTVLGQRTTVTTQKREDVVGLKSNDLFYYPLITLTGHGQVVFSADEAEKLRQYLTGGGFLWADDDFGMDESFRKAMKRVFPETSFTELPWTHEIFHGLYEFSQGLPKIHEHAGGPPHAYGIFHDGRLVVFYSFNTDLGDSLEDPEVHGDPPAIREQGLRMAVNVVLYALTH